MIKVERAVRSDHAVACSHDQANLRKEAAAALGEIAHPDGEALRSKRCADDADPERPQERALGAPADRGAQSAEQAYKARAGA